ELTVPNRPRRADGWEIVRSEVCRSVHDPNLASTGGTIFPDDVGLGIVIEVASSDNFPGSGHRSKTDASDKGRAIQQPDRTCAGIHILKNKIGAAITVEIGGSRDMHRSWGGG